MTNNNNWLEVALTSSIADGDYTITKVQDIEIAIFNINNQFFAIENRCPHQNLPLADGPIADNHITCPFHGAVFSLETGDVQVNPDNPCEKLTVFPVKIENNLIKINLKS